MMKSIALVSIMATIEEIVNEVKCLPISAYQCQNRLRIEGCEEDVTKQIFLVVNGVIAIGDEVKMV